MFRANPHVTDRHDTEFVSVEVLGRSDVREVTFLHRGRDRLRP